jgi:hypothetical protein
MENGKTRRTSYWTKTFGKIKEKLKKPNFWGIFSRFEAEAQLGAPKILKNRRTKVVRILKDYRLEKNPSQI